MKQCTVCREHKPLDHFYPKKRRSGKVGIEAHCKPCDRAKQREFYASNKHKFVGYYQRNKRAYRNNELMREFGISIETYEAMRDAQHGLCAICLEPESTKGKSLSVDHDHATGKVRELLCRRCNHAIGFLRDRPELADNAAAYLRKHRS